MTTGGRTKSKSASIRKRVTGRRSYIVIFAVMFVFSLLQPGRSAIQNAIESAFGPGSYSTALIALWVMFGICAAHHVLMSFARDLPEPTRKLWRWTGLVSWVILVTLPLMRPLQQLLKALVGDGMYIPIYAAFLCIAVFLAVRWNRRRKAGEWREWASFIVVLSIYVWAIKSYEIKAERFHFLEYGILAVLTWYALAGTAQSRGEVVPKELTASNAGRVGLQVPVYLYALVWVTFIGVMDEMIQGFLPARVGELRDVYLNILAGALGLSVVGLVLRPEPPPRDLWPQFRLHALLGIVVILFLYGIFAQSIESAFALVIK